MTFEGNAPGPAGAHREIEDKLILLQLAEAESTALRAIRALALSGRASAAHRDAVLSAVADALMQSAYLVDRARRVAN